MDGCSRGPGLAPCTYVVSAGAVTDEEYKPVDPLESRGTPHARVRTRGLPAGCYCCCHRRRRGGSIDGTVPYKTAGLVVGLTGTPRVAAGANSRTHTAPPTVPYLLCRPAVTTTDHPGRRRAPPSGVVVRCGPPPNPAAALDADRSVTTSKHEIAIINWPPVLVLKLIKTYFEHRWRVDHL